MKKILQLFSFLLVSIICVFSLVACSKNFNDKLADEQNVEIEKAAALPCMYINLYDENENNFNLSYVTKDDYVDSRISIRNTTDENLIEVAKAQFKGRGNGSWECDKKGYRIKFDKKTSLFGREKNKNWVLLACANFEDETMFRNYLAFNMAQSIFDKIEYCTSATFIDLYINDLYQGVYVLCEHVRVDKGRVDITSEYGTLDTGYLIEYDCYATGEEGVDYFNVEGVKYPFSVHSPDPADYEKEITKEQYIEQVAFIKDYVQRAYSAALNYDFESFASLVDVDSFLDMYILHELFKNTDTGWSSFYLYKKAGGKLFAGPPWDFDATIMGTRGNTDPTGIYVADSVEIYSDYTASELYIALYQTNEFRNLLATRWINLSNSILAFIEQQLNETVYENLKTAMAENFVRWSENLSISEAESCWLDNMAKLKDWFIARIQWLDSEWTL